MQFRNFSKYFIITGKVLVALRIKRGSELKAYESAVLPTEHFFVANLAFFFATNKQRKSSEQWGAGGGRRNNLFDQLNIKQIKCLYSKVPQISGECWLLQKTAKELQGQATRKKLIKFWDQI